MSAGLWEALGAALQGGVQTYGQLNEQERLKKAQDEQLAMERQRLAGEDQDRQFKIVQAAIEGLDPNQEVDPGLLAQAKKFHLDGSLMPRHLGQTFKLGVAPNMPGTPVTELSTPDRVGIFRKPSPKEEMVDAQVGLFRQLNDPTNPFNLTPEQRARVALSQIPGVSANEVLGAPVPQLPGGNTGTATGEDALKGLDPSEARLIKQIANYKVPLPRGGFALNNPVWQARLKLAAAYDPTFDMTQYDARQKLRNDFTSGKGAQNIRSLNTVISHLGKFSKDADALDNTSYPAYNAVANWLETQTGDPRVKNFGIDAQAVENELSTLFKGTGATDQEIKAWRQQLDSSSSPEQFQGVVQSALALIAGRAQALQDQWNKGMGKPADFGLLSKESKDVLKRLGGDVNQFDPSGLDWQDAAQAGATAPAQRPAAAPPVAQQAASQASGSVTRAPFVIPNLPQSNATVADAAAAATASQPKVMSVAELNLRAKQLGMKPADLQQQLAQKGWKFGG